MPERIYIHDIDEEERELPSFVEVDLEKVPDDVLVAYWEEKKKRGEKHEIEYTARLHHLLQRKQYRRDRKKVFYPKQHRGLMETMLCLLAIEGVPLKRVAKRTRLPYRWLSKLMAGKEMAVDASCLRNKVYLDVLLFDFGLEAIDEYWYWRDGSDPIEQFERLVSLAKATKNKWSERLRKRLS